jgi:hypothetical protein
MCGGAVYSSEPTVSLHADLDAYLSIVERVMVRGVRVNRQPEMALTLPPVAVCPHCYQNVYHLERPIHATLSIAVRCGDCGWTGRAVVGRY